jgi:hypothetical protein
MFPKLLSIAFLPPVFQRGPETYNLSVQEALSRRESGERAGLQAIGAIPSPWPEFFSGLRIDFSAEGQNIRKVFRDEVIFKTVLTVLAVTRRFSPATTSKTRKRPRFPSSRLTAAGRRAGRGRIEP